MARYVYLLMGLTSLCIPGWAKTDAIQDTGKLSIFRWNQGFRAEREPVFEGIVRESEFRSMVKGSKLPETEEIYKGCYLAHFEPEKSGGERSPASNETAKPKSEVFRICKQESN